MKRAWWSFMLFFLLTNCSVMVHHFLQNEGDEPLYVRFNSTELTEWLAYDDKIEIDSLTGRSSVRIFLYLAPRNFKRLSSGKLKHFTDTLLVRVHAPGTATFKLPPGQAVLLGRGSNYRGFHLISQVEVSRDSLTWVSTVKSKNGLYNRNPLWKLPEDYD